TSWNVQRAAAPPGSRVVELSCAERPASIEDLTGRWWAGGQWVTIDRSTSGRLRLRPTRGIESSGILDGRQILAPTWRARGLLSHDGRYIFWSNETTWRR